MKSYIQQLIEYIEKKSPMNDSETQIWYKAKMLRKAEELENIDSGIFKYKLIVKDDEYYANSLLTLYWEIIRQKFSNLLNK